MTNWNLSAIIRNDSSYKMWIFLPSLNSRILSDPQFKIGFFPKMKTTAMVTLAERIQHKSLDCFRNRDDSIIQNNSYPIEKRTKDCTEEQSCPLQPCGIFHMATMISLLEWHIESNRLMALGPFFAFLSLTIFESSGFF